MNQIRERSHIILWILLFFFLASMTVGGLVGGANILDRILGRNQANLFVGKVGDYEVTHREFIDEQNNQLSSQRQSGQPIDSRALQNARNSAWNTIVDRVIQEKKISEMNLKTTGDEIYDFMLLTPPASLQTQLKDAGYFADSLGNFQMNEYQTALRTATYPTNLEQFWVVWERYLRGFLPSRKLSNLYNSVSTVSDYDVRREYAKKNQNCTLEYIYVSTNTVADSLITVTEDDIKARYKKDKEDLYKNPPSRTVEYVFWSNDLANVDSTLHTAYLDSISGESLRFSSEADYSSFYEALESFGLAIEDTIDVTQGYENNSGIPFRMGVMRTAVRFAFDNPVGSISDPLQADNGIAIFHITGQKGVTYKPLAEVEDNIRRTLVREFKKDYARELLFAAAENSDDFESIAEINDFVEFASDTSKAIGGSFKGIGRSNALTGALRALREGDVSEPIETFSSIVIVRVMEKEPFDEEDYAEQKDTIRETLLRTRQTSVYSSWLSDVKEEMTIEDLRSQSY
ncbi:MAG: SurA N-terminal domain-containing protein [FCB group bacterium]|nr:SurA N-terminal domain-containing protein [FCB group bacterium]